MGQAIGNQGRALGRRFGLSSRTTLPRCTRPGSFESSKTPRASLQATFTAFIVPPTPSATTMLTCPTSARRRRRLLNVGVLHVEGFGLGVRVERQRGQKQFENGCNC